MSLPAASPWPSATRSPSRIQRRCHIHRRVCATAPSQDSTEQSTVAPRSLGGNVVVLGGSGRVGSSTAAALKAALPSVNLSLASRTKESFQKAIDENPQLASAGHVQCNVDQPSSLSTALRGADLVVHVAGPFQRRQECSVLEACIAAGVPYMDVCDDTEYSQRAKALHSKAAAAGVPAITSAGIYPGVSNVMAAHLIAMGRKEYNEDWTFADTPGADGVQPKRLLYSYYTAGSGGRGRPYWTPPSYWQGKKDGKKVLAPPVSNRRVVDFGPGVGRRSVFLYNLPEVSSSHATMGVPSVSARFGTTDVWNVAMWLTARLVPRSVLSNPASVRSLGKAVDPLVRAVDGLVGERVAMMVEVEFEDGKQAAGLYVHERLSQSVGVATAAFAQCMLQGQTQPGVWFPEEREALADRRLLLQMAVEGSKRFVMNRPPWALESNPVQIGMGFYW